MLSKNKKKKQGRKEKAAYRRGEKAISFLKTACAILLVAAAAAGAALGLKTAARQLSVKNIMVSGNYHLDKDDIVKAMNVNRGDSLVDLNFGAVGERLQENRWIKRIAVRKQYPDTLIVRIQEATPKALLQIKKQLFLVDEEGGVLESIKGETVPFLPVIKDISTDNRKDMAEALKLADVLTGKAGLAGRESIEIALESYGLSVTVDGEFIKVGYGNYGEKFDRWIELEPEIRKRGVQVKYVDLRFKDSVIVKPVNDVKGRTSS